MGKRSWILCVPAAATGLVLAAVAGGTSAAAGANRLSEYARDHGRDTPQAFASAPARSSQPSSPERGRTLSLALRMDNRLETPDRAPATADLSQVGITAGQPVTLGDKPRKQPDKQHSASAAKTASTARTETDSATAQQPLNLEVAAQDADDNDDDRAATVATPADDTAAADGEATPGAAFDLDNSVAATPKVKSYNLFNPAYGLHGFMKQGWISPQFAIQGGLGLNDNKRIKSQGDDLSDDIAVGMGLIMAF